MKLRIALLAAVAFAASATAASAAPVSANATAQANIVAPAQLTTTRNLEFGTVAKPTSGTSTITVASAATGTATPSVSGGNAFVATPGQAAAATFHVVGTAGSTYSIQSSSLSFTGQAGNLANVNPETPVAAGGVLGTIPGGGSDDLYVGGRFDIAPTTAVQTYTGTLALTVNFN